MRTLLFFDDQWLQMRDNAEICQGQPALIPESIYRDPRLDLVNLTWGYPCPVYDEMTGQWFLYYQGWPVDHTALPCPVALMASSPDGLHWRPFSPRQEGMKENWVMENQFLPLYDGGARFAEAQVYHDPYADSAERFKALALYRHENFRFSDPVFVSADGIGWHKLEGVRWHREEDAPDYPLGIFWNSQRGSYVITGRPAHCDRRIALRETKDWRTFSPPEWLMQPDCLDRPVSDLYGMPAVAYRGQYIGFLEIYEPVPYVQFQGRKPSHLPTHKFVDGHVSCQLTYSQSGWVFQRFLRQPWIAQDDPSAPDFGGVYPCGMVEKKDCLWIYASITPVEHGRVPEGTGAVAAYRLRKDGFAFLRARNGYAALRTKGLYLRSGELHLNVRAVHGEFKVQILRPDGEPIPGFTFADCQPFSGDSDDFTPVFAGGRVGDTLAGQVIVVDLAFRHADLFSIRGDFVPLTPYEVGHFLENGDARILGKREWMQDDA